MTGLGRWVSVLGLACCTLLTSRSAHAWLFQEHARIGQQAAAKLNLADRQMLERLWQAWRGSWSRSGVLCSDVLAVTDPIEPEGDDCIHFGTLAAIAGDHACTPQEVADILGTRWLREIIRAARRTESDLYWAEGDAEETADIWINSHVQSELLDAQYLSRASANNAHFLMSRSGDDLVEYLTAALSRGESINAISAYATYHTVAIELATRYASAAPGSKSQADFARRALITEAFAQHFLEDAFSAGHTVGTWGSSAYRMGTHDYYSEHGIEIRTWDGDIYAGHGDAHLRPVDKLHAYLAVKESLEQVVRAARVPGAFPQNSAVKPIRNEHLNVCTQVHNADNIQDLANSADFQSIVRQTPMPALGPDDVSLPRFREEVGPFFRFQSSGRLGAVFDGYDSPMPWYSPRVSGVLEAGIGLGYGFEGVTNRKADGQIFAQVGWIGSTTQVDGVCGTTCPEDTRHGEGPTGERVPARFGVGLRARVPFWLIPGDTILASFLLLVNPRAYEKMGITAANGGLIPWQRVLLTDAGSFQFILGREVGFNSYGRVLGTDTLCKFLSGGPSMTGRLEVREYACYRAFTSWELDLPVLEYRPFRVFASTVTTAMVLQAGLALDFPEYSKGAQQPVDDDLGVAWTAYARLGFDARLYLGD